MLSNQVKKIDEFLNTKYGEDYMMKPSALRDTVMSEAIECLSVLNDRLDGNDYFFGSNPSSLDAIIFGYLAPLYKINFPASSTLRDYISEKHNLRAFVDRLLQKYFPLAKECK